MRPLVLVGACLMLACGARPPVATRPSGGAAAPVQVGGLGLVTRHHPTEGRAVVALFVRAPEGSPALRAMAGWALETPGFTSRATPDGWSLRAEIEASALREALASLSHALSSRHVDQASFERAEARLAAHRAGRAHDDGALATRLALEALAGTSLDPFEAGETAPTRAAMDAWLEGAFGVERALVVISGDVDEDAARAAVADAFAAAPHVVALDAARPWSSGPARVALGERDVAAAACTATTLEEAMRVAAWVPHLVPEASATAFPLLGRSVVVATSRGGPDALRALASALRRAHQLDEEAPSATALAPDEEALAIGDAWLAGTSEATSFAIGLGRVRRAAPDEDDATVRTDAALDAAAADAPDTARRVDGARGESTLASGLHAIVARAAGDEVAVALSFEAGGAHDPAREHGRAALLAAVLARSCEPDADRVWVDAARFGVVVRGERASLERTVLRAIDCARRARSEVAHTEGVRAEAIASLDARDRLRAWAAEVLAPASPGRVAPGGSPAGLAAATELDVALDDAIDARRATLAVVADAEPAHLLDVAEAMGLVLRARTDTLGGPVSSGPATSDVYLTDADADAPCAIVALRTDAGASAVAARHLARALARALATRRLSVQAAWGGASLGASYVAVSVRASDAALDALPATAATVLAGLDVTSALEDEAAAEARAQALALGDPAVLARQLASGPPPTADPLAVARALAAATPRLVMIRPTAPPLRRR